MGMQTRAAEIQGAESRRIVPLLRRRWIRSSAVLIPVTLRVDVVSKCPPPNRVGAADARRMRELAALSVLVARGAIVERVPKVSGMM